MIILHKYTIISPKTGKTRDIPRLSSEFSDWTTFGKLSPLISSKKFPRTLRNCPALHKNQQFFWKWGVRFHKSKNFQKTKNLIGRASLALVILLSRISKFWVRIPPSRPEIEALESSNFKEVNVFKTYLFYPQVQLHLLLAYFSQFQVC